MGSMSERRIVSVNQDRPSRQVGRLLAAAALTIFTAAVAVAQQPQQAYEALPINDQFKTLPMDNWDLLSRSERDAISSQNRTANENRRLAQNEAREILRGSRQRTPAFDVFIREYALAAMAQTDDASLNELGQSRSDFMRQFLSSEFVGDNRTYLIEQLVIPTMQQVAEGNFHPAARVNAVTLIGLLNTREADNVARTPPTPNAKALKTLLSILENANLPTYTKVAAVSGLNRIAQLAGLNPGSVDAADVQRLSAASSAMAAGTFAGQDTWEADVDLWMKRRAVQNLGELRQPGANGQVVALLNQVVADANNDIWLRFDAAVALGQLNYPSADIAKVNETLRNMVGMLAQVLEQESLQIRADVEDLVAINILLEGKVVSAKDVAQSAGGNLQAGGGNETADGPSGNRGPALTQVKTTFEMPVYYTNAVRRKCKTYVYYMQSALKNPAFTSMATPEDRNLLTRAQGIVDRLLKESDVGLKDLGRPEDPPAPQPLTGDDEQIQKSVTTKMMNLLADLSNELYTLIGGRDQDASDTAAADGTGEAAASPGGN